MICLRLEIAAKNKIKNLRNDERKSFVRGCLKKKVRRVLLLFFENRSRARGALRFSPAARAFIQIQTDTVLLTRLFTKAHEAGHQTSDATVTSRVILTYERLFAL